MFYARFSTVVILACLVTSCADKSTFYPNGNLDTVTIAFVDGIAPYQGYDGTSDAMIKDGPSNDFRNRCYGTSPVDTLGFLLLAGSFYERRLVIRMDISVISDCEKIISAKLVLHAASVRDDSLHLSAHRIGGQSYSGWNEGQNGIQTGVSWLTRDGAESWHSPGGDFDQEPLSYATITEENPAIFSLPPRLVQDWLSSPESNQGVLIKVDEPQSDIFAEVYLRETTLASKRPRLEIIYLRNSYG